MRPHLLVVVTGTGTSVGKTWVAAEALRGLIEGGHRVSVRKPAQSFSPEDITTDADLLAAASGETALEVCPRRRWYPVPRAPPMAAAALGLPVPALADLEREVTASWPLDAVEVGLVEGAGGVASPQAIDGDTADLARALAVDLAVLVAEPGLGTINSVRLCRQALAPLPTIVHLNRFDARHDVQVRNRRWLTEQEGLVVTTSVDDLVGRLTAGAVSP
jgi:dethiobiotin synthetase